jgi:general secretion pathway protein G
MRTLKRGANEERKNPENFYGLHMETATDGFLPPLRGSLACPPVSQHLRAGLDSVASSGGLRGEKGRLGRGRGAAGITLIELLVVVTIIAMFAALVGPRLFRQVGRSRVTAAHAQINSFQTALGAYKLDTGRFPTTEQGLEALRRQPDGVPRWDGPYLPQDIPLDPWGNAYVYRFPGEHGDEPDIVSFGNDNQAGGEGEDADVVSWTSR